MSSSTLSNNSKNKNKSENKKQESARLSKAKQLLQEFQIASPDGISSSSSSPTAPSSTTQTNNKTSKQQQQPSIRIDNVVDHDDNDDSSIVVSENYWSNGHLQEGTGSFVTRWAQGKKVAEPLVRYDPIAAEKLLFRQPNRWVVRNVQIAFPVGWWAAQVALDFVMGKSKENRRVRAQQLLSAISGLGPAIIKGGQALASRPDLLPSEYLEELQKLQDDVPRFANKLALATVEEELGMPFNEVFELVQEEPVAAASIGQVYKARLLSNGDLVALKIQRPNCEQIIALDLYVLRWWSGLYNRIFEILNRDIDVQSIIDDFGELIYREIDYVAEAANAQRFNELYAANTDVFVPKIYSELTTSKVLTMEWVDGFRLTDNASLTTFGLNKEKLVDILVQSSMSQILQNGLYHCDPHAGNLLACKDGRLCYLDFGMMSYASPQQRNGFLLAVVHIVNRDWGELVRVYQNLGFIPENADVRPIEIALEKALPDVLNADISELNFKNVVNKLGDIMYTYPFSLPPFYIAIIRCLGVLEGLAIQVDPQARIISKAYPYVASRVLTDSQDELQEAFRRLVFDNSGNVRWDRLESLLEEAKESSGYDVTAALDLLTDYVISDEGKPLLNEFSEQIVEAADGLGTESVKYLLDASRAMAINDEVAAVKAFRSLQSIVERGQNGEDAIGSVRNGVLDELQGVLPEPSSTMKRFWVILSLLGAQNGQTDPAKFVPIIRKLGQEPRVQKAASEIIARLGERVLSRSLRAAFGLPPPLFSGGGGSQSTVTEDRT